METLKKPKYQINYQPTQRVQLKCNDPSRTKQSFSNECNVNIIMKKYSKTGLVAHIAKHQGSYGDLTNSADYHQSMNSLLEADSAFASLPSEIRNEFHNNPAEFLDFAQDPENSHKLIEMGLATSTGVYPEDIQKAPGEPLPEPSPEDKSTQEAV